MKKACNREIRSFHCASVMSVLIHSDLVKKLETPASCLEFCRAHGLIARDRFCDVCGQSMRLAKRQGGKKSPDLLLLALCQEGLREGAEHTNGNLVRQIAPYDSADCRIHIFLGTQGKANRLVQSFRIPPDLYTYRVSIDSTGYCSPGMRRRFHQDVGGLVFVL